jgi:hypothetical protein
MSTGFRTPDFGLRIGVAALAIAAPMLLLAQEVTRTPTPAPRLSGGFGRPRATPVKTPYDGGGQGYADVVHAAHETREGAAPTDAGTVTINNKSLVKNSSKGKVSSSKAAPAPGKPAPTPMPSTEVAPAAGAAATAGGEAQWKATAAKARKRVADDKARVAELEAATRKLENDFYAWDDGQYRDRVIKPAWDHSKSELTDAKNELAEAEKDLADLPEKARVAGAMPGWIRE